MVPFDVRALPYGTLLRYAVTTGVVAALTGCSPCAESSTGRDRRGATHDAADRFVVDDADLHYTFRDDRGRLQLARSLAEIPPERRGAVVLRGAPSDGPLPATVRVANLLEASLGDTVETRTMPRQRFSIRARFLERAIHRAHRTAALAREYTKLHPGSRRTRSSREAARQFREIILPRIRRATDGGARPDSTPDTTSNAPRHSSNDGSER